VNILEYI